MTAPAPDAPVVLHVDALTRHFPTASGAGRVTALADVSFDVHRRELITVVGPSGCGKSTLIRIIAGLDDPSAGEVRLDGHPVHGPGADRGMVFQQYTLFPWLDVRDNVAFGLRMQGERRAEARRRAEPWIELVGLTRFARHYPSQLSGGMKQRVAIARALANQPRILLMDEPFGALDAQTRAAMQAHLLRIWSRVDVTILFITHDLDEAVYLSDRVLVMGAHPGRVVEIVDVPLGRPREPHDLRSRELLDIKDRLEELIHPGGPSDDDDTDVDAGFAADFSAEMARDDYSGG
ncbi:ABC transporter ATP-binding protein [Haliangium sp.]|uniref:ABC transporter ATP-binding protein n=1 Tax=Haliangium sp. TaxID=2663208 RepID=UPI003D100E60